METMPRQTTPVFGARTPDLSYRIGPQFVHTNRSTRKIGDLFCMEVLSGGFSPRYAHLRHVSVVNISAILDEIDIDAGLTLK